MANVSDASYARVLNRQQQAASAVTTVPRPVPAREKRFSHFQIRGLREPCAFQKETSLKYLAKHTHQINRGRKLLARYTYTLTFSFQVYANGCRRDCWTNVGPLCVFCFCWSLCFSILIFHFKFSSCCVLQVLGLKSGKCSCC